MVYGQSNYHTRSHKNGLDGPHNQSIVRLAIFLLRRIMQFSSYMPWEWYGSTVLWFYSEVFSGVTILQWNVQWRYGSTMIWVEGKYYMNFIKYHNVQESDYNKYIWNEESRQWVKEKGCDQVVL